MKRLNKFSNFNINEAAPSKIIDESGSLVKPNEFPVRVLSTYDDKYKERKESIESFSNSFDDLLKGILSKYNIKLDNIPNEIFNQKNRVLGELKSVIREEMDINLKDIKSDIIDISLLSGMDSEVDSIVEGDDVIAIIKTPLYHDKGHSGKTMIIEFKAQKVNSRPNGWLGLAANNSSYGHGIGRSIGMLQIEWCDLIVTKESYNDFAPPDKRLK